MIILVNKATKFADAFLKLPKEYIARIKFGIETDTLDIEGKIISRKDTTGLSINQINKVLDEFKGKIKQVPPMYSALKYNGKPLYKIARTGRSVERKTRDIEISGIEVKDFDGNILTIKVCCSSGTYIRSLASDIGKALGTVAVLCGLERIKIGGFCAKGSVKLKEIPDIEKINIQIKNNGKMICVKEILKDNPSIFIKAREREAVINGKRISPDMIDYEKTDINRLEKLQKSNDQNFNSMVTVRDLTGSLLAVHTIIEEIKFDNSKSFDREFTKSIVIY